MRVQRTIRVILSALLMVMLCFCMIGCRPSEDIDRMLLRVKEDKINQLDRLENNANENCHEIYTRYILSLIDDCKVQINEAEKQSTVEEIFNQNFQTFKDLIEYYSKMAIGGTECPSIRISGGNGFNTQYDIYMEEYYNPTLCLATLSFSADNKDISFIINEIGNWTEEKSKEVKTGERLNVVSTIETDNPEGYLEIIVKNKQHIFGYTLIKIGDYVTKPNRLAYWYSPYKLVKTIEFDSADNIQSEQVKKYIEQAKMGIDGEIADGISVTMPCIMEEGAFNLIVKNNYNGECLTYTLLFREHLAGEEEKYECIADIEFSDGSNDKRRWTKVMGDSIDITYNVEKSPKGYIYIITKNADTIYTVTVISVKVLTTELYKKPEVIMRIERAVRPRFINGMEMTDNDLNICINSITKELSK